MSYERHNISELARELGITAPQLYKWRNEYEEFGQVSFPGNGNVKQTPEQWRIAELERKLKDEEIERDIKKNNRHLFQKRSMIYSFIRNNEKIFPIEKMCKVLQVGQRSYYQLKSGSVTDRIQMTEFVKVKITSIYFDSKHRNGRDQS